ncbi:unnamed protein product [Pieris macdunnoughi]|uniref:Reverse transcriptase domain-containing protein n=1 Tax=Pieris macdunnoughi TaxID=345717 RepID=A0A821MNB2_9NEOP|nr:unnamed protein product [Pieris macdunnoughi]
MSDNRLQELDEAIAPIKWDVIGLCESERLRHTTNRLSIAKVATDYYKNLYTETDKTTPVEEEKEAYEAEEIPCILESEVTQATKSQKSGKAPGDDKISNELLKQSLPAITRYVTLLFNKIIETEQILIQWTTSTIILLHKKKQGDPLSPKLFTAVLEDIFRNLGWEHFGISNYGLNLNHLRFADDIVVFADKPSILQTMLQQLDDESRKAGLSMNPTKTKVMTNAIKENIVIGQENIEYVDEYIYLGQLISIKYQYSNEIDRRICNIWKRYWSLKEIVKNKTIPMAIKTKLYNTCILPCLTYGCQTWPTTSKNNQKLVVCQRNMERSMLNIRLPDRWTASKIRKKTNVSDVLQKIRKLKWNWIGHIMRTNKEKWTKDVIEWYPRNGKRKRGGQVKRWEDDLPSEWRRSAKDREMWKRLGEAYVDRQHDQSG